MAEDSRGEGVITIGDLFTEIEKNCKHNGRWGGQLGFPMKKLCEKTQTHCMMMDCPMMQMFFSMLKEGK